MKIIKYARLLTALIISTNSFGSSDSSYVDGSKPFLVIKDVNRQAEAWGTCSAAYDVIAMLLNESNPAQAKHYKELGNGASMAVFISHVVDGFTEATNQDQLNSLWNYSKILADSIPETKKTMILADAESLGESGADEFLTKLVVTLKVCIANLESQQIYIDIVRDFAKSGLITIPNK